MKNRCSTSAFEYTTQSIDALFNQLETSHEGLSDEEAQKRFSCCGAHLLASTEKTRWHIFFRQFKELFIYLLIIAALLSLLIGEITNGMLLLTFVAINVFFSFYQEVKAYNTLLLLKEKLPRYATVKRGGITKKIRQESLVVGDIIVMEAGMIIPADIRIIKAHSLTVNESFLTGESRAVIKSEEPLEKVTDDITSMSNILFAGSSIVTGKAIGIVTAIGTYTQIGAISELVKKIDPVSNYEKNIARLSIILGRIVMLTIPAIVTVQAYINPTATSYELITFAIALIIGIIPEALPAVITFCLARGAISLTKKNVIIKRLSAIEDLGDAEILCVDKTGTLTQNKMMLDEIHSDNPEKMLLYAAISIAQQQEKTGFDEAILKKIPRDIEQNAHQYHCLSEIPFDSNRMRSSFVISDGTQSYLLVRGAPELVINLCKTAYKPHEEILNTIKDLGHQGKRTLAFAYKTIGNEHHTIADEADLHFIGFFSCIDPIKSTVHATILDAKKFGLTIKIITGDSAEVAGYVAKQVGLIGSSDNTIITQSYLETLSGPEFDEVCRTNSVFARITPSMKYSIITALQKNYSVAFLGDGINDAPALKAADVGIAVQYAVDVARDAANVVLLKKDLSVIIVGIQEGRKIFASIDTYVKTTLASNIGNYYSIGLLALVFPFLPLLPIQILLVNILSDFPLLTIATDQVLPENLKMPKRYQLHKGFTLILLLALISMVGDFVLFGWYKNLSESRLRTLWFIFSILTEIGLIFVVRNHRLFFKRPYPSATLLATSVLIILVSIGIPYTTWGRSLFSFAAPSGKELGIIMAIACVYLMVSEMVKVLYLKYLNNNGK